MDADMEPRTTEDSSEPPHILKERQPNENARYKCTFCGKLFRKLKKMQSHLSEHTDTSSRSRTCKECGRKFSHEPCLNRHTLIVHRNLRPFTCESCGSTFTQPWNLHTHTLVHLRQSNNSYKCNQCDEQYNDRTDMIKHLSYHFSQRKVTRVSCKFCGSQFDSIKLLNVHKKNDHNMKISRNRVKSQKTTRGPRRKREGSGLNIIANDEDSKLYQCSVCEKKYSTAMQLHLHRRIHGFHKLKNFGHYLQIKLVRLPMSAVELKHRSTSSSEDLFGKRLAEVEETVDTRVEKGSNSDAEDDSSTNDVNFDNRHKCTVCDSYFPYLSHWMQHMSSHN